ncbi:MAG: hypothetical protein N3E37_06060, partial [Candidatus Micrarchaeota archaeon]|nr:hypothetical protein [Candidatus Micrarchaeota archaeon]
AEILIVIGILTVVILLSPKINDMFRTVQKEQIDRTKDKILENTLRIRLINDLCSLYNSSVILIRNSGKATFQIKELSLLYSGVPVTVNNFFLLNGSVLDELDYDTSLIYPGWTLILPIDKKITTGSVKIVGPQRVGETKMINITSLNCGQITGTCSFFSNSRWKFNTTKSGEDANLSTFLITSNGISGYTFYYDNGTGIYYNDTYVQVNTQSS